MANQKEDIQTIAQLGLTLSQARVYLSLLQTGKATAKTIANWSKMARQEVYRVLAELYEKGLVEKIIATPTYFKAIPIEDCVKVLIENRKKELSEIEKKAAKILQKLKSTQKNTRLDESIFILLPEKEEFVQRARKLVAGSQASIDVVTTSKRFQTLVFFFYKELKEALKRGVKFRVIIENTENGESSPEMAKALKALQKNPLFRIRYGLTPSKVVLSIIDNKELTILTSARTDLEAPTLWTNNPVIRGIIQNYFEMLWISAMETSQVPKITEQTHIN